MPKLDVPSGYADNLFLKPSTVDAPHSTQSSALVPCRWGGTPAGRAAHRSRSRDNRTAAAVLLAGNPLFPLCAGNRLFHDGIDAWIHLVVGSRGQFAGSHESGQPVAL